MTLKRMLWGVLMLSVAKISISSEINVEEIKRAEKIDYTQLTSICEYLSDESCKLISPSLVGDPDIPLITSEDQKLIEEILSVTPTVVEEGEALIPDARKAHLRQAAMTWGVQIGMAAESSRFNRLWEEQSDLLDRSVNFEPLMVEFGAGRAIVPPVILRLENSKRVDAGGRTFRLAGTVYRIKEQPRFSIEPPNWREYLKFKISRPDSPVTSLMPQTNGEAGYWRTMVIRGFLQGVKSTRQRVTARYRKLKQDYLGMVTYHLLREFEMISKPAIDLQQTPVIASKDGSMMAIDDTVAVLSVTPRLNNRRDNWRLYPQLSEISKIQKDSILNQEIGGLSW